MKHKLFSASMLLSVFALASCGTAPANSASSQKASSNSSSTTSVKSESSQSSSSSAVKSSSSSSTSKASSSSSKTSSSSSSAPAPQDLTIPAFGDPVNTGEVAPTMPSPLGSDGKHPATNERPKDKFTNNFLRLFAYDSAPQIYLNFNKTTLKAMSDWQNNRDQRKVYDVYFPANFRLVLDGTTYDFPEVGVRMKGNWSRKKIVDDRGNIVNTSHLKISFKATFDDEIYDYNGPLAYGNQGGAWGQTGTNVDLRPFKHDWTGHDEERQARKDRKLFGMDKIDLKVTPRNNAQGTGSNNNACISREVYSYDRFRENGLLAPYSNLSTVTLNNGSTSITGAYQIVECVDKAFLKKRFGDTDSKGDLYKCAKNTNGVRANFDLNNAVDGNTKDTDGFINAPRKANGIIGCEDNFAGYDPVYQLKTNDDLLENSNFSKLSNVIGALSSIVTDNITAEKKQTKLNSLIDVDYFLKFSALSYLMGNCDDQRYAGNNFYVYFIPSTGKMIHIAYDWDWCLGASYTGFDMTKLNPFDTYVPEGGNENFSDQTENQNAYQQSQNVTFTGPSSTNDRINANYKNNLYWATMLTPTSSKSGANTGTLSYINGYQNTYLRYCRDLADSALSTTDFGTINTTLKSKFGTLKLTEEKNVTNNFITARKTALTRYIAAHPITESSAN
ncbi:MAG: CotH kinase family protein [Bacilli bacterium]|nr:CotH kinase family protein [Bacilli bacterium]